MWVTELEYVKKERDRCLKLLEKKSQKRKKSRLGFQQGDAIEVELSNDFVNDLYGV